MTPRPCRGGESTANGIVFQKKSYATFPRPKVPLAPWRGDRGEAAGDRYLIITKKWVLVPRNSTQKSCLTINLFPVKG